MIMNSTPNTTGTPIYWLSPVIEDAIVRNLCTRIGCSTCGATEFRNNVYRAAQTMTGISMLESPATFARTLAQGLASLMPSDELAYSFDEPTRLLLCVVSRHMPLDGLESMLMGTWAGNVLHRMESHSAALTRERKEAKDPVLIEARRAAKRRMKQEEHAERLKLQAEKARLWHLEHDPDTSNPS